MHSDNVQLPLRRSPQLYVQSLLTVLAEVIVIIVTYLRLILHIIQYNTEKERTIIAS